MPFYKKKPAIIEAVEWTGDNLAELRAFSNNTVTFTSEYSQTTNRYEIVLYINTLEGNMRASKGDFIIKGANNEFYPCKPEIFHKTYEKINNLHL